MVVLNKIKTIIHCICITSLKEEPDLKSWGIGPTVSP